MAAPRTLQAVREILTTALTSPQIAYYEDLGNGSGYATVLLPTSSVVPRSIYELEEDVPSPYVCFAVRGRGSTSRYIADRRLLATFWVVSDTSEDEVTELYEAIRSRVNFGDQDTGFYATNLNRAGTSAYLGAIVREFIEVNAFPPIFDKTTARWQLVAEYAGVAA